MKLRELPSENKANQKINRSQGSRNDGNPNRETDNVIKTFTILRSELGGHHHRSTKNTQRKGTNQTKHKRVGGFGSCGGFAGRSEVFQLLPAVPGVVSGAS